MADLYVTNRFGKRMSISAVLTCSRLLTFISVILIFLQIPASVLVILSWYGFGLSAGCVQNSVAYNGKMDIFAFDCWFPGVLLGLLSIYSSFQTRQYLTQALTQIADRERSVIIKSHMENPMWSGLQLPGAFYVPLNICLCLLTFTLFLACNLAFGPALGLTSTECELPGISTVVMVLHVGIFIIATTAYILSLVGLSSVLVISNNCCQCNYPYPVYTTFSERPYMLPGPSGSK